jgi:hypothetical protein
LHPLTFLRTPVVGYTGQGGWFWMDFTSLRPAAGVGCASVAQAWMQYSYVFNSFSRNILLG